MQMCISISWYIQILAKLYFIAEKNTLDNRNHHFKPLYFYKHTYNAHLNHMSSEYMD